MFIPVILGTAREGRQSEKVAKFLLQEVLGYGGIESELIDVRDYLVCFTKRNNEAPQIKALGEKFKKADGFIIVFPEYNHSYPGELKLLLDSFYWPEYEKKPVGLAGVSMGPFGGARALDQLRAVFVELKAVNIREAVYFGGISNLFDENGVIKDVSYNDRIKIFLDELTWYAKALKEAKNV